SKSTSVILSFFYLTTLYTAKTIFLTSPTLINNTIICKSYFIGHLSDICKLYRTFTIPIPL
ncbi:MAG: hypothetical protein VB090_06705, partial [Petrimonas sp.]|nr:hypothetical protein [Petrimonas sp.]